MGVRAQCTSWLIILRLTRCSGGVRPQQGDKSASRRLRLQSRSASPIAGPDSQVDAPGKPAVARPAQDRASSRSGARHQISGKGPELRPAPPPGLPRQVPAAGIRRYPSPGSRRCGWPGTMPPPVFFLLADARATIATSTYSLPRPKLVAAAANQGRGIQETGMVQATESGVSSG